MTIGEQGGGLLQPWRHQVRRYPPNAHVRRSNPGLEWNSRIAINSVAQLLKINLEWRALVRALIFRSP
jgi:hypothetical protein